jgi:hypothetical protein
MYPSLELVHKQRGHGSAAWPTCRAGAGSTHPDAHQHRQAQADTHPQLPALAHIHTHTDAHPIAYANAHGHPHSLKYTHAHPNTDTLADAHRAADTARGKVAAVPAGGAQDVLKWGTTTRSGKCGSVWPPVHETLAKLSSFCSGTFRHPSLTPV